MVMDPGPTGGGAARRWADVVTLPAAVVGLVALVALVSSPALDGGFHFDDYDTIVKNRALTLPDLSPATLLDLRHQQYGNRLVAMISFALHVSAGLTEARHYRVINILIHCLTMLVVMAVARRVARLGGIERRRALALGLIAGGLWALHPIQVTAVTYIVQRMTSLAALLFWTSFLLYLRARTAPARSGWLAHLRWVEAAVAAALFLLGLLTKSNVVILPAIVVATELLLLRTHRALDRKALLWVGAGGVVVLLIIALTLGGLLEAFLRHLLVDLNDPIPASYGGTPAMRLLSAPRVLGLYLSLLLFPFWGRYSLFWSYAPSQGLFTPPLTIVALVGLAALGYLAWRGRRAHPLTAWGAACFLLAHVPEGTVFPLHLVFEHRMYLPSVFAIVAIVALAARLLDRLAPSASARRRIAVAASLLVMAWLALNTHQRNEIWRTPESFYAHEIDRNPENNQLRNNYVTYLFSKRDPRAGEQAKALLRLLEGQELTKERKKSLAVLHTNVAVHQIKVRKDPGQGLDHLLQATRYGVTEETLYWLGRLYFHGRRFGRRDWVERCRRRGYGDRMMLRALELVRERESKQRELIPTLVEAHLFVYGQDGDPRHLSRARYLVSTELKYHGPSSPRHARLMALWRRIPRQR